MNQFTVTAPEAGFSGEGAGVVFKDGVGLVDDSTKEGRAAIEYFRRRGYTLTSESVDEESEELDGGPSDPDEDDGDEPFDPAEHKAEEVIDYLGTLDRDTDKGNDEFDRVIAAEADGKKRTTILALSDQQGAQ